MRRPLLPATTLHLCKRKHGSQRRFALMHRSAISNERHKRPSRGHPVTGPGNPVSQDPLYLTLANEKGESP
jgi:hypothetical protein